MAETLGDQQMNPPTPSFPNGTATADGRLDVQPISGARIALVHEWLSARAGAEILFEEMAAAFPNADLYALTRNPEVSFSFGGRPTVTTCLDRWPALRERRAMLLPVMPLAWRSLRRADYDLVISSTHAFGREFLRSGDGVHLNYVQAPMRYAWTPELDGRAKRFGLLGRAASKRLQAADYRSTKSVQAFAANSAEIAKRIRTFYHREATVISPPVDTDFFGDVESRDDGYLLAASRWISYKRLDVAIRVAAELQLPLIIAGSGPEGPALRQLADQVHPRGVTFVHQPDRVSLRALMARASAFLFPAHEDFGIIVVEAQAAGTPVIALAEGGTLDTVREGVSGSLAKTQATADFLEATTRCLEMRIDSELCRRHARGFSSANFRRNIRRWVDQSLGDTPSILTRDASTKDSEA